MKKVINIPFSGGKEGSPDKEKVPPYNPLYRETIPFPELDKCFHGSCLSRACVGVRESACVGACVGVRKGRRARRVDRRLLQRMIEIAVNDALTAFHGSQKDGRIWAGIAHRIGADNLHYAVIDCRAEMLDERNAIPARDMPRYFQAFLNRHYPRPGKASTAVESHTEPRRTRRNELLGIWGQTPKANLGTDPKSIANVTGAPRAGH